MSRKDNHHSPLARQSPSAKIAIPIIFIMVMIGYLFKLRSNSASAPLSTLQLVASRDQAAKVYDATDWQSGAPQSMEIKTWMTQNGTYEQVYDEKSHSISLYRNVRNTSSFLASAILRKNFKPRFWQLTDNEGVVRLYLLDDGGWKQALVYPASPETKLVDRP